MTSGKGGAFRDQAIFIGTMGPVQNAMRRTLFFIRFQVWGGYFFPVSGHGADTFFHGAETFLPLNLGTLMKLV